MIDSLFYYPMTLHRGVATASVLAPFVKNLPPVSGVVEEIYVRTQDANPAGSPGFGVYGSALTKGVVSSQGVYIWDAIDKRFRFVMPYTEICSAVVSGAHVDIYYDLNIAGPTIPENSTVYRNGAIYSGTNFTIGDKAVWSVLTSPDEGDVATVNGVGPDGAGNIALAIANIPGLQAALDNAGSVKTVSGKAPDVNGNIVISAVDNNDATGTTILADSGATTGTIKLRTLVEGTGIVLSDDANGNVVIASTGGYTLPVATATILGGVKQGTGVSIAGDGTLSVTAVGGVSSVSGQTGAVVVRTTDNNSATGTSLIVSSGSTTGNATLKTLVGGTGVTLAADGNGNIVINGTATYTLPVATNATLGGVIVQDGLTVDGSGNLSADVLSFNTRTGNISLQLSDITSVGGAPTVSPVLTGTPKAPTPASGDNSTNIATTAFVTAAVESGAAGSIATFEFIATSGQTVFPATFSSGAVVEVFNNGGLLLTSDYSTNGGVGPVTLNSGATFDDEVKIIATAPFNVANVVPITGGSYTGVVQGLTASPGDNSTQLATTAFVDNAISGIPPGVTSFNTRAGAVTLQLADVTGVGGAPLASPALTGTPTAPTPTAGDSSTKVATTAFVATSFAPLASPALTGTPTAPTATAGTNTTQLATTAFVTAAVAAGATGVSSFNTRTGAVTLQLSDVTGVGGAPLASPTFTGTPAAPTATAGNNSTTLATTNYVYGATQGQTSVALTNANVTLSAAQYSNPAIKFTGTLTGNVIITFPTTGNWSIYNATTGAFTVTLSNGVGATVVIPQANTLGIMSDATAGILSSSSSGGAVTSVAGRTGTITLAVADVSGAAPLASPTFTGTPAAPTATAGTSTTQVATTAFVATSFAPLASPALTGTPTVPTASAGTNTTQVASAAFVYNATQATGSVALTNANVTLSSAQYGNAIINFTGTLTGNVVITFPTTGLWTLFNNTTGAFTVTVSNGSGATFAIPQGSTMEVVSSGSTGMQAASNASPVRFQSPSYSYTVTALGSVSGTQTLNLGTASEFTMTITGATTIAFTNTLGTNQGEVVYIRFTNAGSAAITWPASTKFAAATAPTFTASGVDMVGVKYDTTTSTYMVFVVGLAMA